MWTARLLLLACLFAPAALGEFASLELLCVCLHTEAQMWTPNRPWRDLKPHQNFRPLLLKC